MFIYMVPDISINIMSINIIFANICEFVSEICEFDFGKLIHYKCQMFFFLIIIVTKHFLIKLQMCEFVSEICEFYLRSAHP